MHAASQYMVVGDELDCLLLSGSCDLKALN